jgi:hypothetical protein
MVRLAPATLRRYVSLGWLPYYKVSNRVFFDAGELDQWLASRHVPARRGKEEW